MAKTVSAGLNTHIQQEVTTLAKFWKIVRTDGVSFYFTSHDADLPMDGNTYLSGAGFSSTAIANNNDLSVDNLDVMGVFDDTALTDADLAAGLFDYADVYIFFGNWQDTTQGPLKMRRGTFGEAVSSPSGYFTVEIRGMTQRLLQKIVEVYGPECRADLGDNRCKVPINPALRQNSTTYAVGDYIRVATNVPLGGQAQYENRIYKCTQAGVSAGVMPTYDIVVGHNTTEGGSAASGTLTVASITGLNGLTLTLDNKTYTFQTALTNVNGNVLIGATAAATAQNLLDAMNLTGVPGTQYAAAMTAHTTMHGSAIVGAAFTVSAIAAGTAGANLVMGPGTAVVGSKITFSNQAGTTAFLVGGVSPVIFQAMEAWTRDAVVATVTDNKNFTITVTEPRDVDGWFQYGTVQFISGQNNNRTIEIKSWTQTGAHVTLFLNAAYLPVVGDKLAVAPGCDKSRTACYGKFNNLLNMRAESDIPGADFVYRTPDVLK